MDFTVKTYKLLLSSLLSHDYSFLRFSDYLDKDRLPWKFVILRHDVDLMPKNSLKFAQIQYERGVTGTYYFRAMPESWNEKIIQEIARMGHEVGYHYENLTTCHGDVEKAYKDFATNLKKLRQLVPVDTICMHGSPWSKFDSKELWKKYDFKLLGIKGEPYFNADFNQLFYLTDTGRRWDGWKASIRDKVSQQNKWIQQNIVFHSTQDIIRALEANQLPGKIMTTFHPQRWHDSIFPWTKEFVMQNLKNLVKQALIRSRSE